MDKDEVKNLDFSSKHNQVIHAALCYLKVAQLGRKTAKQMVRLAN